MPGFKNKRVVLLVIAILVSALFITAPWKSTAEQDQGAPLRNVIKGPNWGVEITGGTRIYLQLDAVEAKVKFAQTPDNWGRVNSLTNKLSDELQTTVQNVGSENTLETGEANLLIGKSITENRLISLLENDVSLIEDSFRQAEFTKGAKEQIRTEVKEKLKDRVDPQGTLGAKFKPIGSRFLLYEVPLVQQKARTLLGHTGKLEIFIENQLVLWGDHIGDVRQPRTGREGGIVLPFDLKGGGPERWKKYSAGNSGKPAVIYLDRPSESALLIPDYTVQALQELQFNYKEEINRIKYEASGGGGVGENLSYSFYLQIPAGKINTQSDPTLPESTLDLLENKSGLLTSVIWMGGRTDLPSEIIEGDNLILENTVYPIQFRPRHEDEALADWLTRVTGVRSWPNITDAVENRAQDSMSITGLESKSEARELRRVLSQGLPVEIKIISEEPMGRQLSENFVKEAAIAGLAAFIIVGILVYSFYRRLKITLPLLLTMASEVVITFGVASALPSGIMSIGLPGLGGLIAVVGTGVDHQIIITDEIFGEKFSESKQLPIDRRTGKAFSVIFAAAATTIAAMIALALFGFGAMRGFALITLFGVLISVLITRPAYAKIIGTLLERERRND